MSSLTDIERSILSDAFEDAPFEFWARDLDGRLIVANAAARKLGIEIGQKVDDSPVSAEVLASWQDNNRRAYAGEAIQRDFEYTVDGQPRFLQCYIVPLRIHGAIHGILGFNIDVTRHRLTEQALRLSERRLSEALRVGRMGYLDWNLVTNEMRWSPETYRLFGHDPSTFSPTIEATVGMVPPEDLAYVQDRIDAALRGPEPYDIVHRMIRPDGEIIHVHALAEVRRDADGKALQMLGTVVDVTERRRAEQELRDVDRRRSEFLGVLSHELRNPLAVIGSSLRALDRLPLADDLARRALAAIDRQTTQLARLVDDLLDVTRVSSGKINLQRGALELGELIRATVEDHRQLLAGRTLVMRLPEHPVWTSADATRMAQVVGNLLANAGKFTPEGGEIRISLAVADGRALLEVADTGVGIDADALQRMFEPFVQADRSSDRSRGGLGLGLALVKSLVELHDGTVRAHSAGPGQGATFEVALPLVGCEPRGASRTKTAMVTPRKVLVIEDNRDAAEWLSIALSFAGHDVTITYDGDDGLAKARELDPDVIVCDLGLPGELDGCAVARALRADATLSGAYRIALSGYAQPEDQQRAREAGFEAHLAKPPDLDALERLIAEHPRRAMD